MVWLAVRIEETKDVGDGVTRERGKEEERREEYGCSKRRHGDDW